MVGPGGNTRAAPVCGVASPALRGGGGRRPDRTAATASANSPPLPYRRFGSLAMVISMSSRTFGGRSAGIGGGVSRTCFIATVSAPSPVNGRWPDSASYPTTPRE